MLLFVDASAAAPCLRTCEDSSAPAPTSPPLATYVSAGLARCLRRRAASGAIRPATVHTRWLSVAARRSSTVSRSRQLPAARCGAGSQNRWRPRPPRQFRRFPICPAEFRACGCAGARPQDDVQQRGPASPRTASSFAAAVSPGRLATGWLAGRCRSICDFRPRDLQLVPRSVDASADSAACDPAEGKRRGGRRKASPPFSYS